jgi:membrane associated rhomboid family serine protease
VVPFDTGFAHVGSFERIVYLVTLVFAALSAACTIAPSARHRFLFRYDDKPQLVFSSNRVVIAGLSFLALAMCGSLLLVATKLFGADAGAAAVALGGSTFGVLWFLIPIRRRRALDRGAAPSGSTDPAGHATRRL